MLIALLVKLLQSSDMQRVAITGAAGYVGSALVRYFYANGWSVLELGRRKSSHNADHVFFDLEAEPPLVDWRTVNALVHCAHDFRPIHWPAMERINLQGSVRLLQAAAAHGVRGVFISSLSCFEGCRSLYGKVKLASEREAIRLGFSVVRPGLVWGGDSGSMTAALERTVRTSPVVPLIGRGSFPQYLVHKDDLALVVFALCQSDRAPLAKPLSVAAAEKISFHELLLRLAARYGRKPTFVPVPWQLLLFVLRTIEILKLPTPFRSDSLLGIVYQNPKPDFSAAQKLEFSFRRFV